jgi:hypothetical protein
MTRRDQRNGNRRFLTSRDDEHRADEELGVSTPPAACGMIRLYTFKRDFSRPPPAIAV